MGRVSLVAGGPISEVPVVGDDGTLPWLGRIGELNIGRSAGQGYVGAESDRRGGKDGNIIRHPDGIGPGAIFDNQGDCIATGRRIGYGGILVRRSRPIAEIPFPGSRVIGGLILKSHDQRGTTRRDVRGEGSNRCLCVNSYPDHAEYACQDE